ncbi:MAG TPA: ribosomal protein S18-alanine N-acetyltransferase [Anaerolineales bacterium]|nr:ribosomal protein S18-alanine N-acetyltransferase [Anaerolineales bacterium]
MIEDKRITFRPMRKDDLDSVMVIDRFSFSMPWPESAYRHDLIENPNALLRVAEVVSTISNAQVVGMVDVWLILDEAHIATLAVHPDYRGQGIASRLIKLVLIEAHEKGASSAMLEVRASNHAAQSLYKNFGFKIVQRRPRYYYDNKEDAFLMNLDNLADWEVSGEQGELQKSANI